ncbi:hypothetical protein ACOSP7_008227 [Xanthoceras sorbifolium]
MQNLHQSANNPLVNLYEYKNKINIFIKKKFKKNLNIGMQELSKDIKDLMPLGKALEKVKEIASEPSMSYYGTREGLPELRNAPTKKLVSIANPGNPSRTCIPEPLLKEILDVCERAGCWLVVDNAYEQELEGNHVINLFSFSKDYGMMGWRVGYVIEEEDLRTLLLKVQDNLAICAAMVSQNLAFYCLESGRQWVRSQVKDLVKNRELIKKALSTLGEISVLATWQINDFEVVSWLARRHRETILPGSACGGPGCIHISYVSVKEAACEIAGKRPRNGLEEFSTKGMVE